MRLVFAGLFFLTLLGPAWADIATLQAAADAARPGQLIVFPPDEIIGQLVVRKPLVLRGSPGARLVHAPGTRGPTLWVQAPGTVVENLEIDGSG